jgi:hypothetical protein
MNARCPHCDARTRNSPSRLVRVLAVGGAWLVILAMLVGLSLASLFAVPLVPLIVIAGAALVGGTHEFAFGDRICEACGRAYELDGEPIESVVAPLEEPAPVFA